MAYVLIKPKNMSEAMEKIRKYLLLNPDIKLEQSYIKYFNSNMHQREMLLDFDKVLTDEFRMMFPEYRYILWGSGLIQLVVDSIKVKSIPRENFHQFCQSMIQPGNIKTFELLECLMQYYDKVNSNGEEPFKVMYHLMHEDILDIVLLKSLFGDLIKFDTL